VAHVGIADPFCDIFAGHIAGTAHDAGVPVVQGGCYVAIEGPQFSTKAESRLYRSWGASIIGMTAMPEARLAREAEFCYATLAMVTDYDVWHESEGPVTVEMVIANLRKNTETARLVVSEIAGRGLPARVCRCGDALENAIATTPSAITSEIRARLGVIASRYLGDSTPV
jgi:5'-methylthioadenosine phosphorylase